VVWLHFLGDFILQSDKMAQNKSKSIKWLSAHVCVYTIPLLLLGWKFALINGLAHWVVDFFTSKATTKLWEKKEVHYFFVVVGADQALHLTILLLTLQYIF
jgi:hypothetical protein